MSRPADAVTQSSGSAAANMARAAPPRGAQSEASTKRADMRPRPEGSSPKPYQDDKSAAITKRSDASQPIDAGYGRVPLSNLGASRQYTSQAIPKPNYSSPSKRDPLGLPDQSTTSQSTSDDDSSLPPSVPPRPAILARSNTRINPVAAQRQPSNTARQGGGRVMQQQQQLLQTQAAASQARGPTHKTSLYANQMLVFVCFYVGYMCYTLNQKTFSYSLPFVVLQEYFTPYELGLIFSSLSMAMAVSRPVASIICDNYSICLLFSIGLFMSGLVCLAFVDSESLLSFTATSLMNGLTQGFAWTPAAKALRQWYNWKMFGTLWAIMSTAENLANALGHPLSAHLAAGHGWEAAVQVPALGSMLVAAIIYLTVSDRPSDCGFPESGFQSPTTNYIGVHWSDLLSAPFLWVLAGVSTIMACIQTSTRDWAHGYLSYEQNLPPYAASGFLVALEVGGILGAIFSGIASDALVRAAAADPANQTKVPWTSAPRLVLLHIMIASAAVCLNILLFAISSTTSYSSTIMLATFTGFSINGATTLVYIVAVETAPANLAGAAQAAIFFASSAGGLVSCVPIITIANYFNWFSAVVVLEIGCVAAFLIMVLTKDMPATFLPYSFVKKESRQQR